jgi:hypothetical protein
VSLHPASSIYDNRSSLTPTSREQASEANKAFKEFETSLLSEDTAVRRSCFALESQDYESSILDEAQLDIALNVSPKLKVTSRTS